MTTSQTTHLREECPDGATCPEHDIMDSGVETGNDSNDSSTVQHESQHAATAAATTVVVNQVADNRLYCNYSESKNIIDEISQTSPIACADSLPRGIWFSKLLQMNMPVYGTNGTMDILKERSTYQAKIRQRRFIGWTNWRANKHAERKMRVAAATNNTVLMRRLLELGVPPNNHDQHGRTPLHHAACRGYTEMVRLLLQHGADPNQRDCIGNTPLHLATVTSKISVVTLLLIAGTNVLLSDQHGYNPLQLAQTKLRILQKCDDGDMGKVKEEMHNIVSMLLAYLQKQNNMQEQVETLSNLCSRLSLSSTSDQVQDDVKDLLANIDTLYK